MWTSGTGYTSSSDSRAPGQGYGCYCLASRLVCLGSCYISFVKDGTWFSGSWSRQRQLSSRRVIWGEALQFVAYRAGRPVQDIMWSLRLRSQTTLESYLQEAAALNCFAACRSMWGKILCWWLRRFLFSWLLHPDPQVVRCYLSALLNGWSASSRWRGPALRKFGIAAVVSSFCSLGRGRFWLCRLPAMSAMPCGLWAGLCCCCDGATLTQTCRAGWISNWVRVQSAVLVGRIHLRKEHIYIYICMYTHTLYKMIFTECDDCDKI